MENDIYPIIRDEFQNGSDEKQAFVSICQKRELEVPMDSTVEGWLKRLHDLDFSLEGEIGDPHHELLCEIAGQYTKFKQATSYRNGLKEGSEIIIQDRLIFSAQRGAKAFTLVDSFTEGLRTIPAPIDVRKFAEVVLLTLIDDERILVIMYENDGYYLGLLKVDFYELKCSILHDIPLNFYCLQIVVDSLGSSHFVLREFGSTTIRKGRVTDDKIHIDAQEIGIGADLDGLNLMGNQLFALRRSHEDETHWHYTQYELSLDSARKVTESPLIECLADLYRGSKYVWSDNKMYVVCRFDWNFSVAVFDAELRTWAKK